MGVAVTDRWSIQAAPSMDPEQFQLWQALLEERTGMVLSAERKAFLETSVHLRMRELELDDYERYYEYLMAGAQETRLMEWSVLVDRLTVQETSFFRHPSSYALVEQFAQQFFAERGSKAHFNVWSVGCSTGEEPYSLAMLLSEKLQGPARQHHFGITGTDISLPTLAKARKGEFPLRRVLQLDEHLQQKYFCPGASGRSMEVVPALKERVCFARINVLELDKAPMKDMDLIFCQNMLIYFRRWRKRQIVTRLAERLAPGGMLVLGLGEVTDWQHPLLERVAFADTLAYRRRK